MNSTLVLKNVTMLKDKEISALRRLNKKPLLLRIEFARNAPVIRVLAVLSLHATIYALQLVALNDHFETDARLVELSDITHGYRELCELEMVNITLPSTVLIALLPKHRQLRLFKCNRCNFGTSFNAFAECIKNAPPESSFDVNDVFVRDVDIEDLPEHSSLVSNVRLKDADLDNDNAENVLIFLSNCTMLRHLDLSTNFLDDKSIGTIHEFLKQMPSLRVLDLRENMYGDKGKRDLEYVAKMTLVKILV